MLRIDQDVTLDPDQIGDRQIDILLEDNVTAGVKGLQVVQTMKISTPERDYRFVESNIALLSSAPLLQEQLPLRANLIIVMS